MCMLLMMCNEWFITKVLAKSEVYHLRIFILFIGYARILQRFETTR